MGQEKPIFLSIGGLSFLENKDLLALIRNAPFYPDFIELNLSCLNLIGHSIVAYDPDEIKQHLNLLTITLDIMKKDGKDISCGVKLPPISLIRGLGKLAKY